MGKAARMKAYVNPRKAGDFWFEAGEGPKSPTADLPTLFDDGDPLGDEPSVKSMCCYLILAVTSCALSAAAIHEDDFIRSNSGATGGLRQLQHEEGGSISLDGNWKIGAHIHKLSTFISLTF